MQNWKKGNINEKKSNTYSIESVKYLQNIQDKYIKKFINTCFFSVVFLAFYCIILLNLIKNSKWNEVIEILNSNVFYMEITILLLFKNNIH